MVIIAVRVNQENVIRVPTFDDVVYPDHEDEQDEDDNGEDENSSSLSQDSDGEAVVPHAIYHDHELMDFVPEGSVIVFCAVLSAACLLQRCRCEFSIAAGGKGMPSFGTRVPFGVHVHVHVF